MYCSISDLAAALHPTGDRADASTAASLQDFALEAAIASADGDIDLLLRARYRWDPLDTPEVIRRISVNLAAYYATLTFRRGKDFADGDPVVRRYTHQIGILKEAAAGRMTLAIGLTPENSTNEVEVVNPYQGTMFSLNETIYPDRHYRGSWASYRGW